MNIPIFVINLKFRKERWNKIKSAIDDAGLDINRIDAIDGRAIPESEWANVNRGAFARNTAREIFPGEYGCYFSHIMALEAFIDGAAPFGIILEDDVLPDADLKQRVLSILKTNTDFDAVKLVNHRAVGFISLTTTSEGDKIGRTLFGPQGSAAAYLVSREGAKKLVNELKVMCLPWDTALERYWEIDANVLSVKENFISFSEERKTSNIAPNGYSKKISLSRHLLTILASQLDHFRRFHYAALGPINAVPKASYLGFGKKSTFISLVLSGLAILIMSSVFLLETDAYRYAALGLITMTLGVYFKREIWRYDRPLIGWAGILCSIWTLYVASRIMISIFSSSPGLGSAEGIYLFPMFYSTIGFGIWLFIRRQLLLIIIFMLSSLLLLLAFTDYGSIMSGLRAETFTHKNTIHASVAAGFILLFSICFTFYLATESSISNFSKRLLMAMGFVIAVLAIINILVLSSRGVWLATAIALPYLLFSLLRNKTHSLGKINYISVIMLAAIVIIAGAVFVQFGDRVISASQLTFSVGLDIISGIASGNGVIESMTNVVNAPGTPGSVYERLSLWVDAIKLWSQSPILGVGIDWGASWNQLNNNYNIFHNGFIEVGIRYGILGIGFYIFIFTWATRKVFLATKHKLLPSVTASCYLATLIFFAVTILTNSNNRIAIGESYMWLAISFGFYCFYLLQEKGVERPRTWI